MFLICVGSIILCVRKISVVLSLWWVMCLMSWLFYVVVICVVSVGYCVLRFVMSVGSISLLSFCVSLMWNLLVGGCLLVVSLCSVLILCRIV